MPFLRINTQSQAQLLWSPGVLAAEGVSRWMPPSDPELEESAARVGSIEVATGAAKIPLFFRVVETSAEPRTRAHNDPHGSWLSITLAIVPKSETANETERRE